MYRIRIALICIMGCLLDQDQYRVQSMQLRIQDARNPLPPPLYTKFYVYCRLVLVSVITSKIFRDVNIRGIFQSRFIVIIFTCDKSRNFPMVPVLSWYLPYGTCNLKIFLMLFIAILNQCCRDGANRCFPLLRLRPQFQFLPLFGHCLRHRLELFLFFVMI